jgi:hypothetical protein
LSAQYVACTPHPKQTIRNADTILAELSAHHHGLQVEEQLQVRDAALQQPPTSRQLSDDDTRGALYASNVVAEPEHVHPTTTDSADAAEGYSCVNQGKEQVCGGCARSTLAERLAEHEDAAKVARRELATWGLDHQVAAAHE